MKRLASTLFACVLCACTGYTVAHSPQPLVDALAPPPAGLAKICVFRDSWIGSALTTPIDDNDEVVGATEGPGHFCYLATEGEHILRTEVSDAPAIRLRVVAERSYFVEHAIRIGTDRLFVIDAVRARKLALSTDYAVIDEIPEGAPPVATLPTARGR